MHRHDFPFFLQREEENRSGYHKTSIKDVQARAEAKAIREALLETGYNKAQAAKLLGIHRTLLYKKMKKYEISLDHQG